MPSSNDNSTTGSTGSNRYTWESTGNDLLDSILAPKPESAASHIKEAQEAAAQSYLKHVPTTTTGSSTGAGSTGTKTEEEKK